MNISPRDLICGGIGALIGAAVTGAIGYFYIQKTYGPVQEVRKREERLAADASKKRAAALRQLDMIDKEYEERKAAYETKIKEYDERLELYDADVEAVKLELEEAQQQLREQRESEETMEEDRIVGINTGIDRIDGPLTDEEMADFRACDGDEFAEASTLTDIARQRFKATMDKNRVKYWIKQTEHDNRPDFIDEVLLDYYHRDDVLAEGRSIVPNVDDIIDPVVLLRFGPGSGSGDPNVVICRNDELEIDYVIERHDGSYQTAIFGIPEEQAYIPQQRFNVIEEE